MAYKEMYSKKRSNFELMSKLNKTIENQTFWSCLNPVLYIFINALHTACNENITDNNCLVKWKSYILLMKNTLNIVYFLMQILQTL